MEGEEIGVVLARASELREKINNCIARGCVGGCELTESEDKEEEGEEDEAESFFGIRDALGSLERQLAALQDLQQQQRYERESVLAQINRSRMILLGKLKEYKGEDLGVIHEVASFAGESINHDDGLILPPYPSHLPDLFILDDLYQTSNFATKYKFAQNGCASGTSHKPGNDKIAIEKKQGTNRSNRFGRFFGLVAKSVMTFVGVMSILSFAGYQTMPKQWAMQLKAIQPFRRLKVQCPPGKVLVTKGEKSRCLVKERVKVPFESDVSAPNISYGYG